MQRQVPTYLHSLRSSGQRRFIKAALIVSLPRAMGGVRGVRETIVPKLKSSINLRQEVIVSLDSRPA
jgi:hypothetical protein